MKQFLVYLSVIAAVILLPVKAPKADSSVTHHEENVDFENTVMKLSLVSEGDKEPCKKGLIDMGARKKYFTEDGWNEYQKYVQEMRKHLNRHKQKGEVVGLIQSGTQHYSHAHDKYVELVAGGDFEFSDCDFAIPHSGSFAMTIDFAIVPDSYFIYHWRVEPRFPENSH